MKLIIIRILNPDKFTKGVMFTITKMMGAEYVTPPPFDL